MAFVPMAVYFWYRAMTEPRIAYWKMLLPAGYFLLALYTYAPARLFVPVFAGILWLVSMDRNRLSLERRNRFIVQSVLFWGLMIVGAIPLAYHIGWESAESGARLSRITIFDGRPLPAVMLEWVKNYVLHLSPGFLFFQGDENLRHNPAVFGQVHWYLFPLLLAGVVRAVVVRDFISRILLVWFLCFPIAAACTRESIPHALRSVFAVPVIQIVSVYGMMGLAEWIQAYRDRFSASFIPACYRLWLAALVLCAGLFLFDLFVRYPVYSAAQWEYGYKEAVTWWQEEHQPPEETVVSGIAEYPHIFFLFYTEYSPQAWMETQQIDQITFVPTGHALDPFLERKSTRTFYLARPFELSSIQPDKVIRLPDGDAVWKWIVTGGK
jgi:hypothetical protein